MAGVLLEGLATGVVWLQRGDGALIAPSSRQVYVYARGTSTQVQVYSDQPLTTPVAQPLTLGSDGSPGGIPGFVAPGQSIDFVDVSSGKRTQAEPLSATDLIGSDGKLGGAGSRGLPAAVAEVSAAVTYPEAFGAVGDGATDDTTALLSWAASGTRLELKPGKTYIHRQAIDLTVSGTVLSGNGGTLKRINQSHTTTATTLVANTTTAITVADASAFKIGDLIFSAQGTLYSNYHAISNIAGNVITVSSAFDVSMSGTSDIYLGFFQLYMHGNNQCVRETVFDGNSANTPYSAWAVMGSVFVAGLGNRVEHNKFNNAVGDAMETFDAKHAVFDGNVVNNCTGRGFSYGGGGNDFGSQVINNRFFNCESNANAYLSPGGGGSNDGHGAINFSLGGKNSLTQGNYIDTGITGVGGCGDVAQNGARILDNYITNCPTAAIEGIGKSFAPNIEVLIARNTIETCGPIQIARTFTGGGSPYPEGWKVISNILLESSILLENVQYCHVEGNYIRSAGTSLVLLQVTDAGDAGGSTDGSHYVNVKNNIVIGGAQGILLGDNNTYITIEGNQIIGPQGNHLSTGASTWVLVANNHIVSTAASTTTGKRGILVNGSNVRVVNNNINMSAGSNGANGILTGSGTGQVTIQGNDIRVSGSGSGNTIFDQGNRTIIRDNRVDSAPPIGNLGAQGMAVGNSKIDGDPLSGTATLAAGTVTVTNNQVITGDHIILSRQALGGTAGSLSVGTITNATSFVINSSNAADTSVIYWELRH